MVRFVRAMATRVAFAAAAIGLASAGAAQSSDRTGAEEQAPTDPSGAPSDDVRRVTEWVLASNDAGGSPFIVIDKVAAHVFVFDSSGELLGSAPALLGSAAGDDSVPGVGDRELSDIKPAERTTPAGRFVAKYGLAAGNRQVLWVDYATSISLHPVVTGNKKERRLQRLKSSTPEDNRITYGCINVPRSFYKEVVRPLFTDTSGLVYILPETQPLSAVFPGIA